MSATSKLVGFSATTGQNEDEAAPRVDLGRRRYLMRFVVVALGLAGLICVAAGVRIARARSAAAQEDVVPTLSLRPLAGGAAPAGQAEPPVVVATAAVAAPPEVAAAPAPATAAPAAVVTAPPPVAGAPAKPLAAAAPTQNAPPVRPRPAAPRPIARPASGIVHAAPF
jgi:translation initiation factor IF-3